MHHNRTIDKSNFNYNTVPSNYTLMLKKNEVQYKKKLTNIGQIKNICTLPPYVTCFWNDLHEHRHLVACPHFLFKSYYLDMPRHFSFTVHTNNKNNVFKTTCIIWYLRLYFSGFKRISLEIEWLLTWFCALL